MKSKPTTKQATPSFKVGTTLKNPVMISLTETKTSINKKYGKGGWKGSSSPLRRCSELMRIGGGPLLRGTNIGGGVAFEDEDVEDDDVEDGGGRCGD